MLVVHLVRKEAGIDNWLRLGTFQDSVKKKQKWRRIFWMGRQNMRNKLAIASSWQKHSSSHFTLFYTSRAPVIWSSADISNPGSQIGLEKKQRMGFVLQSIVQICLVSLRLPVGAVAMAAKCIDQRGTREDFCWLKSSLLLLLCAHVWWSNAKTCTMKLPWRFNVTKLSLEFQCNPNLFFLTSPSLLRCLSKYHP